MAGVLTHLQRLSDGCLQALSSRLTRWTKPLTSSLPLSTLTDLGRSKSELIAENALLRQQLLVLRRGPAASSCSRRPITLPEPTPSVSGFARSVRQECLDHVLILHEKQLQRVLNAYVAYFNQARPHQGIQQQIPASSGSSRSTPHQGSRVVAVPILAGLHHDYRKVA